MSPPPTPRADPLEPTHDQGVERPQTSFAAASTNTD